MCNLFFCVSLKKEMLHCKRVTFQVKRQLSHDAYGVLKAYGKQGINILTVDPRRGPDYSI